MSKSGSIDAHGGSISVMIVQVPLHDKGAGSTGVFGEKVGARCTVPTPSLATILAIYQARFNMLFATLSNKKHPHSVMALSRVSTYIARQGSW